MADYNGDSTHDFFDMSQFLTDYGNADPDADFNGDGLFTYNDVATYQAAFSTMNGTMLENRHYTDDFRNQLIGASTRFGGTEVVSTVNAYDALARRVSETVYANEVLDASRQLVYGGVSSWEVLEQIDLLTDETSFTHVFGIGIDDEVSYRIEDLQTPEDYWAHRDDLGSLTSITDGSGAVVERYEYGDYGDARVFDASGTPLIASVYTPQHLYTGRMVIGGTVLLDYRFRVLETETGRFGQRDPLGPVDGLNLYTYVNGNPLAYLDPYGLRRKKKQRPIRPVPGPPSGPGSDCPDLECDGPKKSLVIRGDTSEPWFGVGLSNFMWGRRTKSVAADREDDGYETIFVNSPGEGQLRDLMRDPCVVNIWFVGHGTEDGTLFINDNEVIFPSLIKTWRNGLPPLESCTIRGCNQGEAREEWEDAFNVPGDSLYLRDGADRWWYPWGPASGD